MKKIQIFLFNTVILIVTSLIISSCSMFFDIYVANKIGSESIGLFGLIMSVYMFAMTIANSGISLASTRIVAEELSMNSESGAKIAIQKCILYSLFFGSIACILLILLSPLVCKYILHDRISSIVLYIIAISLPFSSITISITGYFTGVKRIYKNSLYDIFGLFMKITFIVIGFKIFNYNNIETACIILVGANTLSEIISFVFLYILYFYDSRKNLSKTRSDNNTYLKRILKISLPVAITSYIRSGLSTIKHSLIPIRLEKSGLSCETSLSTYGMINGMAIPILMFPGLFVNSISSLLIPEFARYNIKKDFKRMNEIINILFRLVITFSICVIGIYLLFPNEISKFTYNNIEIAKFVLLLCPLLLFMYLDHVIDAILKGIDKQVGVMFCNILDLFISIFLIYNLIPIFGIIGYIIVIYISEFLNFSVSLFQLYRATKFNLNIVKILIIPLISIFVTMIISTNLFSYTSNIFNIICNVVIFIFIYLFVNIYLNVMQKKFQ